MSNGALKTESRTQKQPERLNDVNWKDNIEKARSKSSQFRGISPGENTLVTQLSFSGGTGSGAIAEMILNGDLPVPELSGNTPLEAAHTPVMDRLAGSGWFGQVNPIIPGEIPNTHSGTGMLMGLLLMVHMQN